ncbi:MAG: VWA domain-containing protein [Candidatus Poribacteria bacterium]|nr:VWA domain-containing protein [Candidatus Poribacteria bacterium]
MRAPTRRALFISLFLHLIALFIVTLFVVRQRPKETFVDPFVVETFSIKRGRILSPPPQIRPAPVPSVPRQQLVRVPRIISPKSQSPPRIDPVIHRTPTTSVNTPRHALDSAQLSQTIKTDLSTAVRELRTDTAALPQTEATVPTETGNRGLNTLGPPGVQRTRKSVSLREALEVEVDGDTVVRSSNLFDAASGSMPKIGFDVVMTNLAEQIVERSEGGPIDVVFVIDASGSMGDNIRAVAKHLIEMIEVYKSAKIDYALGLTEFWAHTRPPSNKIRVLQLTTDMREYQRAIQRITPRRDEHALDAIDQTIREMRFRPTSKKHLIVVTDELFTSIKQITPEQVIALCREFGIYVNVLGLNNDEHRRLAKETGGVWHAIPEDAPDGSQQSRRVQSRRSRYHARRLRHAQWSDVAEIGKSSLENLVTNVLDVILFIDSSKSMADKLPQFLTQFEGVMRDWDNALIDYQIGVVRFHAGTGTFNYLNVFQPPQTMDDIRKIINLPCQGNENLLDAIVEGMSKIKFRPEAQPYLILVTDEPSTGQTPPQAVVQLCFEAGAKVGVVGTFDRFQQEVAMKTNGVWVPIPGGKTTNSLNW